MFLAQVVAIWSIMVDVFTLMEETVAGINCCEINLATFATVSSVKDLSWPFRDS